jgi:hypothetical protein
MLAYVNPAARGQSDRLLITVAQTLAARGWALAGAVQENTGQQDHDHDADGPCDMDLRILPTGQILRISQSLGPMASGCRLDSSGLEQAVGIVAASLAAVPRLLIVNKFGRQESEGRGFRPVIGQALMAGIPVLTTVGTGHAEAFARFAEGMGTPLAGDLESVLGWCTTLD